jgi:hypothetical protein
MKMSNQNFELRYVSILEQWTTRRELAGGDAQAGEAADAWRTDQLSNLHSQSDWSREEIETWFARLVANRFLPGQ